MITTTAIKNTFYPFILSNVFFAFGLVMLLSACTSSDNDPPANDDPPTYPPTQPTNPRATVHSIHDIELFWGRSEDDGWVTGYDVYRDDELLSNNLDDNRYYDNTVVPDTSYKYSVIAIDNEGNKSAAAIVEVMTPQPKPILNIENYIDIVPYVLTLYTGINYRESFYQIENFTTANTIESETYLDPQNTNAKEAIYSCAEGGTATFRYWTGGAALIHQDYMLEDCKWDSILYDGFYSFHTENYGNVTHTMRNYSITKLDNESTLVNGTVNQNHSCKLSNYKSWEATIAEYRAINDAGTTVLTEVNTTLGYGTICLGQDDTHAILNGSLTVKSPETGNQTLLVSTPVEFRNDMSSARVFTKGKLLISAEDGSSIDIDASNGNDATVALVIKNADGLDMQGEVLWDQWEKILTLDEQNNE